jgi:hypothetical protein
MAQAPPQTLLGLGSAPPPAPRADPLARTQAWLEAPSPEASASAGLPASGAPLAPTSAPLGHSAPAASRAVPSGAAPPVVAPSPAPSPRAASPSVAPSEAVPEQARDGAGLRALGIVTGVVLAGSFFLPVGPGRQFAWELAAESAISDLFFLRWIYPAGMGVLLVLFALLPLPARMRGALYALLGLTPFACALVRGELLADALVFDLLEPASEARQAAVHALSWRVQALGGAVLVLTFGHLLRARRWDFLLARVAIGAGILGVLAAQLVPLSSEAEAFPPRALFAALASRGALGAALGAVILLPGLYALLSFASFAGNRSSRGGKTLAVLFLSWIPGAGAVYLVQAALRGAPVEHIVEISRLAVYALACQLAAGFGLAWIFRRGPAGIAPGRHSSIRGTRS